ncbi:MAG TPA: hypothetical protein ENH94_07585 [Phycisphaerales bacterium]|nr:hypothetical protein [Phycisphaerales bacterium]
MIELGSTVQDVVTGFTGIAVARFEFMYGCTRYSVLPKTKKGKEGTLEQEKNFDEPQLIILKKPPKAVQDSIKVARGGTKKKRNPGGPCPHTPRTKDPTSRRLN